MANYYNCILSQGDGNADEIVEERLKFIQSSFRDYFMNFNLNNSILCTIQLYMRRFEFDLYNYYSTSSNDEMKCSTNN